MIMKLNGKVKTNTKRKSACLFNKKQKCIVYIFKKQMDNVLIKINTLVKIA